jgi:hypothetical protein
MHLNYGCLFFAFNCSRLEFPSYGVPEVLYDVGRLAQTDILLQQKATGASPHSMIAAIIRLLTDPECDETKTSIEKTA